MDISYEQYQNFSLFLKDWPKKKKKKSEIGFSGGGVVLNECTGKGK